VADGELLHIVTGKQEQFTIAYRLKDLEARLDPTRFIRLGRGALANIDHIARVTPLLGGMYTIRLQNGQELDVSRIQSRILRSRLLQI
jgi:two-component system LytT family response regulator